MRLLDDRTGLEVLAEQECLGLLAGDVVGRLAVLDGGAPVILPVNYVLDGSTIVFRTDGGTKVDQGPRSPVCFEIDRFDVEGRSGWSVVVKGLLEEVPAEDASLRTRLASLGIDPWAGGVKAHWMRLLPTSITGRRLTQR